MPVKTVSLMDVVNTSLDLADPQTIEDLMNRSIGNIPTLQDPNVRHGFFLGANVILAQVLRELNNKAQ